MLYAIHNRLEEKTFFIIFLSRIFCKHQRYLFCLGKSDHKHYQTLLYLCPTLSFGPDNIT